MSNSRIRSNGSWERSEGVRRGAEEREDGVGLGLGLKGDRRGVGAEGFLLVGVEGNEREGIVVRAGGERSSSSSLLLPVRSISTLRLLIPVPPPFVGESRGSDRRSLFFLRIDFLLVVVGVSRGIDEDEGRGGRMNGEGEGEGFVSVSFVGSASFVSRFLGVGSL